MEKRSLKTRIMSLALCFAFLMQGCFVMPVFAEMTYSGYTFEYHEALYTGSQVLTMEEEAEEISTGIPIIKDVVHPILVDPSDPLDENEDDHSALDRRYTYPQISSTSEKIDPAVWTTIPKPRRIVGYTFDGWYRTEVRNTGQGLAYTYTDEQITSDSTIEDRFLDNAGGYLPLYGKWTEYTSPTLTSNSLKILKKNSYDEDIEDTIQWTDAGGTVIPSFDSEITDYYANVYGTMNSIKLSIEQYEPKAQSAVTFNGQELTEADNTLTVTNITAEEQGLEAYKINKEGKYERFYDEGMDVCVTGKKIETSDYLTLKFVDEDGLEDGYNIFKVVVTLPDSDDNAAAPERKTRTYTFHIKRLNRQLDLAHGNVPYGFLTGSIARANFDSSFVSSNTNYNPKAWNIYYPEDHEVLKGSVLDSSTYDYINYDKDETALVVYEGEDFTDPGVALSDRGIGYAPGATIESTGETVHITRTITADVVNSLKFNDWRNLGAPTEIDNTVLQGTENENVITVLNHKTYDNGSGKFVKKSGFKYIKPGVYDMTYTYENGTDLPVTAVRKLIVLPKATDAERNDLNMDGYVNALDTLVYEDDIAKEDDSYYTDFSEWLYRYRTLDVTTPGDEGKNDGSITADDKTFFRSRGLIYRLYEPRTSADKSISLAYTAPASPSGNKAQMYMELLGVSGTSNDLSDSVKNISSSEIPSQDTKLDAGDTFVTGYRLANTSNFGASGSLRVFSFAITYDTRYIQPLASTTDALKSQIYAYNPNLADYDIECKLNERYQTPDNTTAKINWQSTTQLRTMRVEMYLQDGKTSALSDGYLLKLPFRVLHVTPSPRIVMGTLLGAETFTMQVGDNGYMWDTGDALNTVTMNLMGVGADGPLEYMGDYNPNFAEDTSTAIVLDDADYGVEYSCLTGRINKQLDLDLPAGLTYIPSTGVITGTPAAVYGDEEPVIFYIDGQKYSITVKKAPMHVKLKKISDAENAENVTIERTYGDMLNPDLSVLTPSASGYSGTYFEFDENDIKFPDDVTINGYDKAAETIDSIVTTSPTFTCDAVQYTDATDAYPIEFQNDGAAANYYFVCDQTVTMKINPRPVTITDVSAVPPTSINADFPGEILEIQAANKETTGITYTYTTNTGDILDNDTVIIEYTVAYDQNKTDAQNLIDAAKAADPSNPNITADASARVTNIEIVSDKERGKNYVIEPSQSDITKTGSIADTQIVSFDIVSPSQFDFEYGERIDLNRGYIRITYDAANVPPATVTFAAALRAGLKMDYVRRDNSGRVTDTLANVDIDGYGIENNAYDARYSNDGRTIISSNNPLYIRIKNDSDKAVGTKIRYIEVKIRRKQIRIKANDKIRVYGDGLLGMYTDTSLDSHQMYRTNGTTLGEPVSGDGWEKGFTYSLLDDMATAAPFSDPITDITEAFTPVFTCEDADNAGLDIDSDKTEITRDIGFAITDNNCVNYELIPMDGNLTIKQRPITIEAITGNVPRLTSKDYIDLPEGDTTGTIKAAPYYKNDISAFAGALPEGESAASMTVTTSGQSGTGLYTNDSGVTDNIRLDYDVIYTDQVTAAFAYAALKKNATTTQNVTISTRNLVLPDSYGKNHNYVLQTSSPTGPGVMHSRYMESAEVTNDLKTTYTYGERLDYTKSEDSDENNNIHIVYDSGESEDITFKQAADNTPARTDFEFVKDPDATSALPDDNTELVYAHSGYRSNLRYVGPYDSENPVSFTDASSDADGHFTYPVKALVINKHKLTLRTNVVYTTYGDDSPYKDGSGNYTFTYDLDDPTELQFGDDAIVTKRTGLTVHDNIGISGFTPPTIECYEDDGETPVNEQTDVGLYTIRISGASADNYDIVYKTEDLVIRPKALVVSKLTGLPNLTARDAAAGTNLAKNLEISVAYDSGAGDFVATGRQTNGSKTGVGLEFASGMGLQFPKDSVTITCTANYPAGVRDPEDPDRKVDLTVTNAAIKGTSRNYYLQSVVSPQLKAGYIEKRTIRNITIPYSATYAYDPSRNSDGSQKIYTYGEPYDWDSFRANIEYDNGDVYEMLTYDELKEHGVNLYKIVRIDETNSTYVPVTDTEKENMDFLTFDDHDGMQLVFYIQIDENVRRTLPLSPVQIRKRPMRVKADYLSYTYGDTPPSPTVTYNSDDFAVNDGVKETAADIDSALTSPHSYTYTTKQNDPLPGDGLPHEKTAAGDYVVTPSGAETQNYFFIYDGTDAQTYHDSYDTSYTPDTSYLGANTLKVIRRPLNITRVTDGIPALDAEKAVQVTRAGHYTFEDLTGAAVRNDDGTYTTDTNLTTDGLLEGDTVTAMFNADYRSNVPNTTPEVYIENFRLAQIRDSHGDAVENQNANYDLQSWPSANGEVIQKRINKLEFKRMPYKLEYTYGEWFNISDGLIYIYYNDGLSPTEIHFKDAALYGLTLEFVKKEDDSTYSVISNVKNNTLLTVKDYNNAYFRITPPSEDAAITGVEAVVSAENEKLTVNPKRMRVKAVDETITYGSALPTFTFEYNLADLVNGDTLQSEHFTYGQVDPSSYKVTVHDSEDEPVKMRAGTYDIHPIGAENVNYAITPVAGTLTVSPIPVKITAIRVSEETVPKLTSEIMYLNGGQLPIQIPAAASFEDLTFDSDLSPLAGDTFGVEYKVVYSADNEDGSITPGSGHTVSIADLIPSSTFPDSVNYVISGSDYPDKIENAGIVDAEEIIGVDIVADPTLRDDNVNPIRYTHGDILNLARGSVTVTYDSGRVTTGIKFTELAEKTDGLVKAVWVDKLGNETNIPAENGTILSHTTHDGESIKLVAQSKKTVTGNKMVTEKLSVSKAVITVKADEKSRYYGDENPEFTMQYVSGFVDSDGDGTPDTLEQFMQGLKSAPSAICNAERHSPTGEYDITLTDTGVHDNYSFKLEDAKLTVEKRPLDIVAITGGIPELSAQQIHDEPQLAHRVSGTAVNTSGQIIYSNLFQGDAVKITYVAVYNSIEPDTNVIVSLTDVLIDETFGDGSNYKLRSKPLTLSGGVIKEKQISAIEIMNQPKLNYIYGETLDLSGGNVRITYNDGSTVPDLTFENLGNYGISITLTDAEGNTGEARPGDRLTVPLHTGAYMTLYYPETMLDMTGIQNPVTRTIKVEKKPLNIYVHNHTCVYGDELSYDDLSYEYGYSDFEYNESYRSLSFLTNLIEPEFVCLDRDGKKVSSTSTAGDYVIKLQNGESDNYRFVYNNGILTISRRPLTVTNILSGIPELTSDIIHENRGETHRLTGKAGKSEFEYENLVNDDDIGIIYTAVYTSEQPDDAYDVGIEDITMDDSVGRSANYIVNKAESVTHIENGGVIHDKEITKLEITTQPTLSYTYGDKLDLSGGRVTITYDSGLVEKDVPLNALTDTRIQVAYTNNDGEITTLAADGDKLTVPEHDGVKVTLSARSVHKVADVSTPPLSVAKKVLEFGTIQVEPVTYDGKTTDSTAVIRFTNTEYSEDVTASGNAKFENADAGDNKPVTVTNIVLDEPFGDNYVLAQTTVASAGRILKAKVTPQAAVASAISVSDDTNTLTITPPSLTETQQRGGMQYEYSVDGGVTWQDSNVFENLPLGQECRVTTRVKETANYSQSGASDVVSVNTFKNEIVLYNADVKPPVELGHVFTNETVIETEADFKALLGNVETVYYKMYTDEEKKTTVSFPLELTGLTNIYTTLKKSGSGSGGGGGGGGGNTGKTTPSPTSAPTTAPTVTPSETDAPKATDAPKSTEKPSSGGSEKRYNEPYLNGYDGEIRPDDYMTRAEAATLMVILSGGIDGEYPNVFPDVREGTWYIDYIAAANAKGLISGFETGLFYPEISVTREQFTYMITKFVEIDPVTGETSFSDVSSDRWSAGSINAAYKAGIVSGYDDSDLFMPEEPIRRSEAVRMINVATGREPEREIINTLECPFTDLPQAHWAYYEIMKAAAKYELP